MANPLQLSIVSFQKGSFIIVEGREKSDHFYIIRQGKIQISKEVEVVEEEGRILEPGDFFGVISTMSSHSHIETAMALADVSLIAVHRDQYDLLIERNALVAIKIIQEFSQRNRFLDEALTRLTLKSTAQEGPEHLFAVAEYYAKLSQYNQAFYAYYRYMQYCANGEFAAVARERLKKIQPYAKAVYLNDTPDFNRTYPKNTMIFSESEPGKEMYILQRGTVKISKIVDNKEIIIALLKPGDMFGEMALLENKERVASAIAHDEVTVLVVNKANFQKMVQTKAQLITRLTQILAERIWFAYKQLANTSMTDPLGRLYGLLYIQLEKNRVPIQPNRPYTFEFGPKELTSMAGLPPNEGNVLIAKVFENKKLKVLENRIQTTDVEEIRKQTDYFKKMEKINKARKKGSLASVG